ncbi:hypothetical protein [Nocardia seriolae]|uniref:Antibiotic biosynthesis monooxygenase n=1 Tax=Nocardia seriolae TaxID=37332 RepID=A0A0B8NAQ9_9NOCA|nr:hypothetical protein [Nocardia seriolae]APA98672.1 hypothetical protein NS506_04624 [Nocardia seriolae]MTJ63748.1 hypothetical protein [Nocardia seriolae]MTJ74025.1 hypothetical protein [Nocardia seriolae]MTJ88312.1 hypothetical protein [Nocardia seriolae]MTK32298.1 hypothetical protein [Nocardia seriolae]
MYLAAYHFDGDPGVLAAAYHRLMAGFPEDAILLHAAVRRPDGFTVYDACPDVETFRSFSTGDEFREMLSAVGLPAPRVEPLGEVESSLVRQVTT